MNSLKSVKKKKQEDVLEDATIEEDLEIPQYNSQYNRARIEELPLVSSHSNANKIFSALGVSPEQDCNLRIFDQEDSLVLVHYLKANVNTSHIRGIVVDSSLGKVVCHSFPYTKELTPNDEKLKFCNFNGATLSVAYEGTILRVYFANGQWRVSTHRKINASESKWSGKPFGNTFQELWGQQTFDSTLKRTRCYAFLLSDPENKIVCTIPKAVMYHVGTFVQTDKRRTQINQLFSNGKINPEYTINNPNVETPEILGMSKMELCEYLIKEDISFVKKATGVLVTTSSGKLYKIVPPSYWSLRTIRGNEPSFKKMLMENWRRDTRSKCDPQKFASDGKSKVQIMIELFPEKDWFNDVISDLEEEIPVELGDLFHNRFVEGVKMRLDQPIFLLLTKVHRFYQEEWTLEQNIRYQMARTNFKNFVNIYEIVTGKSLRNGK